MKCVISNVLLYAIMLTTAPIAHAEITGRASVIDGDTIKIHGQRIRLHGIDAPEGSQECTISGKAYRCGQKAAFALDNLIAGKTVRCEEKDRDKYQRSVAECFTGSTNLNAWMVACGWALAYRQYSYGYTVQEEVARDQKAGIWAGAFQKPWIYRHGSSLAEKAVAGDCLIKGNINAKGERIYHVPGSSWYGRTKIDMGKGERWFCFEAEANAAGWKKAGLR